MYPCEGTNPAVGVPAPGVPGVAGVPGRVGEAAGEAARVGLATVVGEPVVGEPVVGLPARVTVGEAIGALDGAIDAADDGLDTGALVAVGEAPHAANRPTASTRPPSDILKRFNRIGPNSFPIGIVRDRSVRSRRIGQDLCPIVFPYAVDSRPDAKPPSIPGIGDPAECQRECGVWLRDGEIAHLKMRAEHRSWADTAIPCGGAS